MTLNLRAKCTNHNGASATYTWRGVECQSMDAAIAAAHKRAVEEEARYKPANVSLPYQTKSIEISFPTDAELEAEDKQHWEDKMVELMMEHED